MDEKRERELRFEAFNALRAVGDVKMAVQRLVDDGFELNESSEAVAAARREIKQEIRIQASVKMAGGLALLLLFGAIWYFMSLIFYVIIPFAAFAFAPSRSRPAPKLATI